MKSNISLPRRQEGVILIIALVVLVLVTILGVSTLRTTTMQEKMAGNSRDRDKALQAAEAAVQSCLAGVSAGTFSGTLLTPSAVGSSPVWNVASNWTNNAVSHEVSVDVDGLNGQPRCMVEVLDATAQSYRVTGRALGGSDQTVVMLQATMSNE